MMRLLGLGGLLCGLCLALAPGGVAKPLIDNSEDTAAKLCLERDAPAARLVDLCRAALGDPGLSATQDAEVRAILGEAYLTLDRNDEARPFFEEALEADPGNTLALNGMGWVHWEADEEAQAVTFFRRSVDLRPSAEGLAGLASSLWHSRQGDLDEIFAYLDAAGALDPEYMWAKREHGWILFDLGRYEEALAKFQQVSDESGPDWNAEYGQSRALAELERYDDALLAINRAVTTDPDMPWGYSQRAYVLRQLDRNAQAIVEADRAIALAPDAPVGYLQKALAQRDLGHRGKAIESFEAAEAAGATDDLLLYWFADLVSDDGDMARARVLVDRAIALDAKKPSYHLLQAWIAVRQEAWDDTKAAADAALHLDPKLAYPHYYRAVAIANTGRAEVALGIFDQAVRAGIGEDMIGVFAADLVAAGHMLAAVQLRLRY